MTDALHRDTTTMQRTCAYCGHRGFCIDAGRRVLCVTCALEVLHVRKDGRLEVEVLSTGMIGDFDPQDLALAPGSVTLP